MDQKIDPVLFGYAVGGHALLTLVYYHVLDRRQERMRALLKDPAHIAVISYPLVIAATILGYVPILLYAAIGTGSFYYFCIHNHLRYLKRRLFTLEERELFDRKADKISQVSSIGSMLLLACVAVDPTRLDPVLALVTCYVLSDIGLLAGFTYFFLTLDRQSPAKDDDAAEREHE